MAYQFRLFRVHFKLFISPTYRFIYRTIALLTDQFHFAQVNSFLWLAVDKLDVLQRHIPLYAVFNGRVLQSSKYITFGPLVSPLKQVTELTLDSLKYLADLSVRNFCCHLYLLAANILNLVLQYILVHNLIIKLQRIPASNLIVNFASHRLDQVGFTRTCSIVERIVLSLFVV